MAACVGGRRRGRSARAMLAPSSTARSAASHSADERALQSGAGIRRGGVEEHRQDAHREVGERAARRAWPGLRCVRTGCSSSSRRHCSGVSARRLPSPPRQVASVITSFSRIGSMGGLVTWANCCLKYRKRSCGRSLRTASGASLPMLPVGSSPLVAIGVEEDLQVLARVAGGAHAAPRALRGCHRRRRATGDGRATRGRACSPRATAAYGFCDATSRLISSSPTRRPRARSTRSILPGCRRPFSRTSSGSKSSTPSSLAATTKPLARHDVLHRAQPVAIERRADVAGRR